MNMSYFPGCTLKNKARDLDIYARECARVLGIDLRELDSWQCCGGVFTISEDEIATKLSSVRSLAAARDRKEPLVTVCSACHNVIKQTNHAMKNSDGFASKVNRYLNGDFEYNGETEVLHYLEMLRDHVGFESIKSRTVKPLTNKKIGAYYGCLLLRPSSVMKTDDPENPSLMEQLIEALGGRAVVYAQRNECCSGYVSLQQPLTAKKNCEAILTNAKQVGAQMLVTACPLCKYNLEKYADGLPVLYFTELLAEALGLKEADNG